MEMCFSLATNPFHEAHQSNQVHYICQLREICAPHIHTHTLNTISYFSLTHITYTNMDLCGIWWATWEIRSKYSESDIFCLYNFNGINTMRYNKHVGIVGIVVVFIIIIVVCAVSFWRWVCARLCYYIFHHHHGPSNLILCKNMFGILLIVFVCCQFAVKLHRKMHLFKLAFTHIDHSSRWILKYWMHC